LEQRAMEQTERTTWQPAQSECRAVVTTGPATAGGRFAPLHSSAAFLTQLLAIRAGLPQTRERRREEPEVAAHVYEAGMTMPAPRAGSMLRRAM
jgi:hypothetical protein